MIIKFLLNTVNLYVSQKYVKRFYIFVKLNIDNLYIYIYIYIGYEVYNTDTDTHQQ
jgi:hypothetical protein